MPILVVDDKAEIRSLISDLLVDEGYTVAHAANGREALAYLHAVPALPCVIILDLMMPFLNGWDFLRARQGNPVIWAIPTVVISDLSWPSPSSSNSSRRWCMRRSDRNAPSAAAVAQRCEQADDQTGSRRRLSVPLTPATPATLIRRCALCHLTDGKSAA